MRTIFTTGQVAKICKVAPRTVSKWFDSGRLRGYRIPGSQDRRIPREHLIRFLKEHGMPLGELEDEAMGKLLLVGVDLNVRGQILDLMPPEDYKIESAASGFEAGIQAESLHPDCVVIDFGMGRHEATLIAQNLRKNNEYADAVLVALLSDDDTASGFDRTPFNETFRQTIRLSFAGRTDSDPRRSEETIGLKKINESSGERSVVTRDGSATGSRYLTDERQASMIDPCRFFSLAGAGSAEVASSEANVDRRNN